MTPDAQQPEHCEHHDVCHVVHTHTKHMCPAIIKDGKSTCDYDTRSRPHPPAPAHLNTQPQGCTCEDCIRFRDAECPYPDSNITMDRCNSFLLNIDEHDAAIARAATLAAYRQVGTFRVCVRKDGFEYHVVPVEWLKGRFESLRQSTTGDEQR